MTNKVFLPYQKEKRHNLGDKPFHWLCWCNSEGRLKGKFEFKHNIKDKILGSDIIFDEEEDMQMFVLMWGEYL